MEKKTRKCEKCASSRKIAIFELTPSKLPESFGKPFIEDKDILLVWKCINCGHEIPFRYRKNK